MAPQIFHHMLSMENETGSAKALSTGECLRCGGFVSPARYIDLLDDTGQLEFVGVRCVQCGEVVDPVIRRNRARQQGSGAYEQHTSDKTTQFVRRVV